MELSWLRCPMTPEQLEAAAILVCEKRGIVPCEGHEMSDGRKMTFIGETSLQSVIDEVKAQYEVLTSIAKVLDMEVK